MFKKGLQLNWCLHKPDLKIIGKEPGNAKYVFMMKQIQFSAEKYYGNLHLNPWHKDIFHLNY